MGEKLKKYSEPQGRGLQDIIKMDYDHCNTSINNNLEHDSYSIPLMNLSQESSNTSDLSNKLIPGISTINIVSSTSTIYSPLRKQEKSLFVSSTNIWNKILLKHCLFFFLSVICIFHVSDARTTVRSTTKTLSTTIRTVFPFLEPQQSDSILELRPNTPVEPLHNYRTYFLKGVSTFIKL